MITRAHEHIMAGLERWAKDWKLMLQKTTLRMGDFTGVPAQLTRDEDEPSNLLVKVRSGRNWITVLRVVPVGATEKHFDLLLKKKAAS